jgi:Adenomatosis polyposis coli down-regulated 1
MKEILLALVILGGAVSTASAAGADEVPSLKGNWQSENIESYGNHFATRSFTFSDKEWSVVYRAYADAEGAQPLFRLDVGGFYVVGGPSAKVPEAFEGIFPADHRHITAESDAAVQMFAGMNCKLENGKATPLVNDGCGFVPGLMQAMGEYDLVAMKDGKLHFGDRLGDLTKARPDKLTTYPLVRK